MAEKFKKQMKKHYKAAVALVLIFALAMTYAITSVAKAAASTLVSDTLTDSRPASYPNHDIKFKMDAATTIANTETLSITFTGFTTGATSIAVGNWQILHDADGTGSYTGLTGGGTDYTVTTSPGTADDDPVVIFTFTSAGATAIGTDKYMEIILTNASDKLPNPVAGVKTITIGGNFGDTGTMKVAIIAGVTVSATIAETLTASVNSVTDTNCTMTADGGSKITSTATTVPFSTINSGTFYNICQDLRVGTNASGGYSVKVYDTQLLTNASLDTIAKGDCDGGGSACSDTVAAAWSGTSNAGFGYCMDDQATYGDGAETADAGWGTNQCGAGTQNFKTIGTDTANSQNIMSSDAAVADDRAYIGYRLNVGAAQPAGTYTTTIVYVATPVF